MNQAKYAYPEFYLKFRFARKNSNNQENVGICDRYEVVHQGQSRYSPMSLISISTHTHTHSHLLPTHLNTHADIQTHINTQPYTDTNTHTHTHIHILSSITHTFIYTRRYIDTHKHTTRYRHKHTHTHLYTVAAIPPTYIISMPNEPT